MDNRRYDLVLRGGRVVCPASGIDGIRDVAVRDGRIAAVEETILPSSAAEVIDVSGKIVLPGMIDTHAHVYQYVTGRFGLNPDMVGVRSGVTTVVWTRRPVLHDPAGLPPLHRRASARRRRCSPSSRPTSWAAWRGHFYPNLYSPDGVDIDATVKSATENRDLVRGIKGHAEIGGFARWASRSWRWPPRSAAGPTCRSTCISASSGACRNPAPTARTPTHRRAVIPLLRPGDVLAHPFTRHPGGFINEQGEVHHIIRRAMDAGLKVDVGHGTTSPTGVPAPPCPPG